MRLCHRLKHIELLTIVGVSFIVCACSLETPDVMTPTGNQPAPKMNKSEVLALDGVEERFAEVVSGQLSIAMAGSARQDSMVLEYPSAQAEGLKSSGRHDREEYEEIEMELEGAMTKDGLVNPLDGALDDILDNDSERRLEVKRTPLVEPAPAMSPPRPSKQNFDASKPIPLQVTPSYQASSLSKKRRQVRGKGKRSKSVRKRAEKMSKHALQQQNNEIATKSLMPQEINRKQAFNVVGQAFLDQYLSEGKPRRFWSKQGYFKNTYLGGDLRYQEELRTTSAHFRQVMADKHGFAWAPPLDAPSDAGMTLSSKLSHPSIDQPQRVILQIGLKGSERYGWRRPALNLMISVDPRLLAGQRDLEVRQTKLVEMLKPIIRKLNVADQVGLTMGSYVISPKNPEQFKEALLKPLKQIGQEQLSSSQWRQSMEEAGARLNQASADPHRTPGAQAIIMLCGTGCVAHVNTISQLAHTLNIDGTLTSVIDHSGQAKTYAQTSLLWQIAASGHGGFWITKGPQGLHKAIDEEFNRFSRVVARLLRLSIKLSAGVELIEVIGSHMLNKRQATRVKAREKSMDKRLSARLGIKSDRGEDDEGVQVVIPAFYGGDSHMVHLALWVKDPGEIAEVTLKYKDMVRAKNASHSSSVSVSSVPKKLTLAHQEVRVGANAHLIAAQSIKALKAGQAIKSLPSIQQILSHGLARQPLTYKEAKLLSRAHLGRPFRQ
jgi:hypothetical protein